MKLIAHDEKEKKEEIKNPEGILQEVEDKIKILKESRIKMEKEEKFDEELVTKSRQINEKICLFYSLSDLNSPESSKKMESLQTDFSSEMEKIMAEEKKKSVQKNSEKEKNPTSNWETFKKIGIIGTSSIGGIVVGGALLAPVGIVIGGAAVTALTIGVGGFVGGALGGITSSFFFGKNDKTDKKNQTETNEKEKKNPEKKNDLKKDKKN